MTKSLAIALVLLSLPAFARSSSVEEQVLQVQEEAREALLKSDLATLERVWGDEFTSISASGQVRTKEEILSGFRTGETKYLSLEYDELKIRVYGKTAVMTGRARGAGVRNGVQLPASAHGTRFTQVFVKRTGGWKLVAHQATTIAE